MAGFILKNMYLSKIKNVFLFLVASMALTFTACVNQENNQFNPVENSIFTRETNLPNLTPAPDFTLETMNGAPFTLSEQEGKIVVLNIWATWCPPCRDEIPDFIEIQNEMKEDVLFLGVSLDEEGWDAVRPFAEEFEINYPLVVDDGTVTEKYGPIMGIPMSFVINRDGDVEYVIPGMIRREVLQPALEELAGEKQNEEV